MIIRARKMKTKNNQTTLISKDIKHITNVLILAEYGPDMISFVIEYWNKTPEEKEEVNEKARRYFEAVYEFAVLYFKSSESQKEAILAELSKLAKQQAVADLHKILGINTYDDSNEMTFSSPYQYPEDVEKGDPQQ